MVTKFYFVVSDHGFRSYKNPERILAGPYGSSEVAQEWIPQIHDTMAVDEPNSVTHLFYVKEYSEEDRPKDTVLHMAFIRNKESILDVKVPHICKFEWPAHDLSVLLESHNSNNWKRGGLGNVG